MQVRLDAETDPRRDRNGERQRVSLVRQPQNKPTTVRAG